MAGDANFDKVSLLLHFDGANGSTAITDNSLRPKVVTCVGDAKISTAQYMFGGSSAVFDGTGDDLSIATSADFDLGDTYTVEFFCNPVSLAANGGLLHRGNYNTGPQTWSAFSFSIRHIGAATRFYFYGLTNASEQYVDVAVGAAGLQVGVWKHVAMVRSGATGYVFIGGALAGTISGLTSTTTNTSPLLVGNWSYNAGGNNEYFNGYIDEIRITKGFAHYTSAFVPPAAAFVDYSGQVSGVITDVSGSPAARNVRVYRRDTGALIGSTTSDATTGAYSVNCPTLDEVTVIALDAATNDPLYDDVCARVIPA